MPTCPAGHDSTDPDFCDVCGIRIGGPATGAAPAAGTAPAGTASGAPAATDSGAAPASATVGADATGEPCPQCGAPRSGQFCETCGFDFVSGKAMSPSTPSAPAQPDSGPAPAPGRGAVGPDGDGGTGPGDAGTGPGDGSAPSGPGSRAPVWTAVVTADRAYYDGVIAEGGPDAASIEFPGYCPERRFRLSGQEMRIGRRSMSRGLEPEIDLTGPPTDPGVSHLHAVLIAEPDGSWVVLDPGSANGTMVNDGEIPGGVKVPLHDGDRICIGAWTVLTIRTSTP
jgi:FHA domain